MKTARAYLRQNALTVALLLVCVVLTIALFRRGGQNATIAVEPAVVVGHEPSSQPADGAERLLARIIPELDLGDQPKIAEALETVARSAHCAMDVNWKALEAQGFGAGEPSGLRGIHRNITVTQAIEHIVSHGAKFGAIDGAVYISNDLDFSYHKQMLVYNVRDIIEATAQSAAAGSAPDARRRQDAIDQLSSLITNSIDRDTWRDHGGNIGSITEINGLLVITQTPENHQAIGDLLRRLRKISRQETPSSIAADAGAEAASEPPIDPALVTLSKMLPPFPAQRPRTLEEALRLIQEAAGRQILVDWVLLSTAGIVPDTPINIAWPLEPMTVHDALKVILASVGHYLCITRQGNLIIITTADQRWRYKQLIDYNVRDLIDAIIAKGAAGPDDQPRVTRREAVDQLTQTITTMIDPGSWHGKGGNIGSIQEIMGILVVQQTPENQDAVRKMLEDLRKANTGKTRFN